MNNSINNEKKTTGMISEISSIPFLFFLTLPTDAAFPFLKTGNDFLGIEQENFFLLVELFFIIILLLFNKELLRLPLQKKENNVPFLFRLKKTN
ncbi:hypothetical protein ACLHDF_30170 [Priestia aryabhattai]|uniref:hypothetical protein n=1 Tax=Priestia megaterium TaxID=1404 RepID=UPI0039B90AFD